MRVPFVLRDEEAEKAVEDICSHIKGQLLGSTSSSQKTARILQIYGLQKVGKMHFAQNVCSKVEQFCNHSGCTFESFTYNGKDLAAQYQTGNTCSQSLTRNSQKRIILIVLLRVHDFSPDLLQSVLLDCLSLENIYCIFTSCQKLHLARLGPNLKSFRLKCLSHNEGREYMDQFGVIHWTQTRLDIVNESKGFPYLLHLAAHKLFVGNVAEKDVLIFIISERVLLEESFKEHISNLLKTFNAAAAYFPGPFNTDALATILNIKCKIKPKIILEDLNDCGILSPLSVTSDRYFTNCLLRKMWEEKYDWNTNTDRLLQNRFCAYYAKLLKELNFFTTNDQYRLFEEEFPNLNKLIERAVYCIKEQYDILIEVAHKAEYLIIVFLQAKERVVFYEACLEAAQERKNCKDVTRMRAALGHALFAIKADLSVAQMHLKEAEYEMTRGDYEPYELASLMGSIGQSEQLQGNPAIAIGYFTRAISYLTSSSSDCQSPSATILGDTHFRLTIRRRILFYWCQALVCLGDYEEGINKLDAALTIQKKIWGYHPRLGFLLNYKGIICQLQGDKKNALKFHKEGLQLRLKNKTQASVPISRPLCHVALGYLYCLLDTERAMLYIEEAFRNIEAADPRHPDISFVYQCKGEILKHEQKYEEARECFMKAALQRWESYGIGSNCCSAESFLCAADASLELQDINNAITNYIRSLSIELKYFQKNDSKSEGRIKIVLSKMQSILEDHSPSDVGILKECISRCDQVLNSTDARENLQVKKASFISYVQSALRVIAHRIGTNLEKLFVFESVSYTRVVASSK